MNTPNVISTEDWEALRTPTFPSQHGWLGGDAPPSKHVLLGYADQPEININREET